MIRHLPFAFTCLAALSVELMADPSFNPAKVAIVKADDYWGNHSGQQAAWDAFVAKSRELGIKVSLGVVGMRVSGNTTALQWLQQQEAAGDVEAWNHGWDHSTWTMAGTTYWEFKGSGLAFQQTHFSDAQAVLLGATGRNAIAFGPPFNQFDEDTVEIMNGTPALRLFFTHNATLARSYGLDERVKTVRIVSESGGTGIPDAAAFISANPNGPAGPVSLQFHPAVFTAAELAEYAQIVQFLLGKGYTFLLPAEYIAALDGGTGTPVNTPPQASAGETSTTKNQAVDIDLRTLGSDAETPASGLRFGVGAAVNGSVALLADGYTARFTPAANSTGSASFSYTVRDRATDARTLLNYNFQPPDVTGDGLCTDVSGNARHGTFTARGAGSFTYITDRPAPLAARHTQSLRIYQNGSTDGAHLVCGMTGTSVINFKTANWTAAGWVKRTNTTDQDIVFHLGANLGNSNTSTPTPDFTLAFNGGLNTLSLKNYSSAGLTSTPDVDITATVNAGEWHHFAIVRSGSTLTLYVDGVNMGSDNTFNLDIDPTTANVAKFGAARVTGDGTTARIFNGSMADLALFNAALSTTDITDLQTSPVADLGGLTVGNSVSIAVSEPPDTILDWRQFHFETTENSGIAADSEDPDRDGFTNRQEYIMGTVPKQPESGSPLVVAPGAGVFTLSFVARQAAGEGYAGLTRRYTVEANEDLSNPLLWESLPGHTGIVGGNQTVTISPSREGDRCFYRLSVTLD